jgi:hypothetical protein
MANVIGSLFGGGKPAADPVKAQTGDGGEFLDLISFAGLRT